MRESPSLSAVGVHSHEFHPNGDSEPDLHMHNCFKRLQFFWR